MGTPKEKATSLNYSQKLTLVRLVKDSEYIFGKKTDHASVKKKGKTWQKLTDDFNAAYPLIPPKGIFQLKGDWEYIETK